MRSLRVYLRRESGTRLLVVTGFPCMGRAAIAVGGAEAPALTNFGQRQGPPGRVAALEFITLGFGRKLQ